MNEGWISSDHNAITFEAVSEVQRETGMDLSNMAKFITKMANWDLFDEAFARKASQIEELRDQSRIILLARKLRRALVDSCRGSMPVRRKTRAYAKWWNKDLTTVKNLVHRQRKKFQKGKKCRRL